MSTTATTEGAAVVTGGSQGIGRSIAARLAAAGFPVVSLDLVAPAAEDRLGGVTDVVCDITDSDSVAEAAARTRAEHGTVGVLVNNAGTVVNEPFRDQSMATYTRMVDVNLMGVLHMCHHFLPLLPAGAAIVNVASDAARIGVPREAAYAAAKAGVIAFSKSLAAELGKQDIRVNVVSPGTTLTPLVAGALSSEQVERRLRGIPLRRLAVPDDVAEVVCTLALEWRYVTGQVVSVNGGAARVG